MVHTLSMLARPGPLPGGRYGVSGREERPSSPVPRSSDRPLSVAMRKSPPRHRPVSHHAAWSSPSPPLPKPMVATYQREEAFRLNPPAVRPAQRRRLVIEPRSRCDPSPGTRPADATVRGLWHTCTGRRGSWPTRPAGRAGTCGACGTHAPIYGARGPHAPGGDAGSQRGTATYPEEPSGCHHHRLAAPARVMQGAEGTPGTQLPCRIGKWRWIVGPFGKKD
jgi:hypothetical protein